MSSTSIPLLWDIHSHRPSTEEGVCTVVNHEQNDNICTASTPYASIGIHPWQLNPDSFDKRLRALERSLADRRFVAIGEVGLDKLRSPASPTFQLEALERLALLAQAAKLPLIIHCVKAAGELMALHKRLRPSSPWVWHGFRGNPQLAEALLKQGFYLSFGPRFQTESLLITPPDRLLLETDDSLASPHALLKNMAALRQVETEAFRLKINDNAQRILDINTL